MFVCVHVCLRERVNKGDEKCVCACVCVRLRKREKERVK